MNRRRVRESTGTTNHRKAERVCARRLNELYDERLGNAPVARHTFGELVEVYKADYLPRLKDTARTKGILKRFLGFFGPETELADIGERIGGYEAHRARAKRPPVAATLVKELGVLRRVFNVAKKRLRWVTENPVDRVELPVVENDRVRYLDAGELQRLFVALPGWLRPIATLARHTGLRRANLLELCWPQIDLQRRTLYVLKTKSGAPLGLPLTDTAMKVLKERSRVRHLSAPYVFCDRVGEPFKGFNVSKTFERTCKKAGIKNLRFHDLRHDFASCLVQAGVDLNRVRELLGHKDLRMTLRYAHLAPENLRSAVEVLDDLERSRFGHNEKKGVCSE